MILSFYLYELCLFVKVRRSHGREGDPLQLAKPLQLVEDVAQFSEESKLVGQRNLKEERRNEASSFFIQYKHVSDLAILFKLRPRIVVANAGLDSVESPDLAERLVLRRQLLGGRDRVQLLPAQNSHRCNQVSGTTTGDQSVERNDTELNAPASNGDKVSIEEHLGLLYELLGAALG
jgi:hypothetical protein